jgi:alpha-mannosidase
MSSESGFELGRPMNFHYALVPHRGDWREAEVYRDGLELTHPLIVRKCASHKGDLPATWSLFESTAPNVVLTAFKPGPDNSTIIRLYEAAGKPTKNVGLKFHAKFASAFQANLLEDSTGKLKVSKNSIEFDLHPFEIKTIKLDGLRPGKS